MFGNNRVQMSHLFSDSSSARPWFAQHNAVLAAEAAHVTGTLLNLIALDDLPASIPQQDPESVFTRPCKTNGPFDLLLTLPKLLCSFGVWYVSSFEHKPEVLLRHMSMLSLWPTFNQVNDFQSSMRHHIWCRTFRWCQPGKKLHQEGCFQG